MIKFDIIRNPRMDLAFGVAAAGSLLLGGDFPKAGVNSLIPKNVCPPGTVVTLDKTMPIYIGAEASASQVSITDPAGYLTLSLLGNVRGDDGNERFYTVVSGGASVETAYVNDGPQLKEGCDWYQNDAPHGPKSVKGYVPAMPLRRNDVVWSVEDGNRRLVRVTGVAGSRVNVEFVDQKTRRVVVSQVNEGQLFVGIKTP